MRQNKITTSSTAEYFAKNLQQVGFSSPTKAVLTTLKESIDNSLDACEFNRILPELSIEIKKIGKGSGKNTDLVELIVEDNGPGIELEDLPKVFGEYLASSKFGKGQCSRGQQGIGISASVTWAQLTNARGVVVTSKTKRMKKAIKAIVNVNIKGNKGIIKRKEVVSWKKDHGVRVEFRIDGRIQLNGDGGLLTYLEGTTLVNPHLSIAYKLLGRDWIKIERVATDCPTIPEATLPHPHTMKLGEFISYAHLYDNTTVGKFLQKGFSRVTDNTIRTMVKTGLNKKLINQKIIKLTQDDYKNCFHAIQNTDLVNPSTKSVLIVGEQLLAKSIHRLGEVDFLSVITRKPKICDSKPTVVEVAISRFRDKKEQEESIQLLRFANRVPLQFDKSSCAITHAVESVNWRSYGIQQSKKNLPTGPYVFAISIVSPFIKFKNASKETIDASEELVEEIRRALMQAGQKLSRHIRKEHKANILEEKISHIEKFAPILIEILGRITKSNTKRKERAKKGLAKLLGRDTKMAKKELQEAEIRLETLKGKTEHLSKDTPEEEKEQETPKQLELIEAIETGEKEGKKKKRKKEKGKKKKAKKEKRKKEKRKKKKAKPKKKTLKKKVSIKKQRKNRGKK